MHFDSKLFRKEALNHQTYPRSMAVLSRLFIAAGTLRKIVGGWFDECMCIARLLNGFPS